MNTQAEGSAAQDLAPGDRSPAQPSSTPDEQSAAAGTGEARWFERAASPRFAIPILLVVCGAAFFVNLGGYPLYTKGEPREAVEVLDMFRGHSLSSVLLPMRAGVEIPSKPLLMHWLIALLALITGGVGEWTVRIPSAILATAGVICCYAYVRRLFDVRAALLSAIILATSFLYLQSAGGARVDMTLTFFMEVAFFEFLMIAEGLTARRMLLYLALAAAVLAKGPVGVALPAVSAAIFVAVQRRWSLLDKLDLLRGALVLAVLAGGWYVAATVIGGRAFFDKQVLSENVFSYLNRPGISRGHNHSFYYMALVFLPCFLPWSVVLPFAIARIARIERMRNPRLLYLVIWFGVVMLFYSFAFSKRSVYLLALFPAIAAIVGLYLAEELTAPKPPRWMRPLSFGTGAFFALAAIGGLAGAIVLRLWPSLMHWPMAQFGITAPAFVPQLSAVVGAQRLMVVVIAAAMIAAAWVLTRTAPGIARFTLATATGITCLSVLANLYVLPATANTLALKQFAIETARMVKDGQGAYLFGLNYDVAFYSGRTFAVVAITPKDWPEYLILGEDTYRALASREMSDYTPVLKSGAIYLDGTGQMLLVRRKK